MVLKNVFIAAVCAVLFGWNGLASADQYQPGQFLGLDLSKAVLSPKPLGPATEFAPVAVEAKTEAKTDAKTDHVGEAAQARAEPKANSKITIPRTRVAHRAEPPRGAARTRLARRHGNPLDAEAFDTRIQVWPCRSGGICDWQR